MSGPGVDTSRIVDRAIAKRRVGWTTVPASWVSCPAPAVSKICRVWARVIVGSVVGGAGKLAAAVPALPVHGSGATPSWAQGWRGSLGRVLAGAASLPKAVRDVSRRALDRSLAGERVSKLAPRCKYPHSVGPPHTWPPVARAFRVSTPGCWGCGWHPLWRIMCNSTSRCVLCLCCTDVLAPPWGGVLDGLGVPGGGDGGYAGVPGKSALATRLLMLLSPAIVPGYR